MSLRALALAFRDIVNKKQGSGPFAWPGLGAKMALSDGKPPACAGDLYVGISGGTWKADYIEGLHEIVGIRIWLTRRGGCDSVENWPENYIYNGWGGNLESSGLLVIAERIRAWTHLDKNQDAVLNRANSILDETYGQDGSTVYGYTVPLQFLGASNPEVKSSSWWTGQSSNEPYGGLMMYLDFGECHRYQPIEDMT